MFRDMTIGQYFPGNTPIHKLDPRTKIILTFVYIIVIFLIDNFWGYLYLLVFLSSVVGLSKIPVKFMLKGLKPLMILIIFTAAINLFMTSGDVIFRLAFLKITQQGVYVASFMVLRIMFLILGTSILTFTTSPISLTDGIEKLLNPLKKIKVPAHELAMMMTIALRFIPTLVNETDKIMKAQMARGADFESGNVINRAKSMVPILVPLFISAFKRADELAIAMESRCYNGGENRTKLRNLSFTKVDLFGLLVFIVFMIGIIAIRRWM